MEPYSSTSGKPSGAIGYELGDDFITVAFLKGRYKYTHRSCGKRHLDAMTRLALASRGLSSYIAQHDPAYAYKW
jgi:hypothetical protein